MSDTHSVVYRYSFDQDDLRTYPWRRNYVTQPEILDYLKHVVEKYDLRKDMQFNTELISAEWDDDAQRWIARCGNGDVFVVRYLILALGQLSAKNIPDIPGINRTDLKMKIAHSSSWDPYLDVRNKRVGIIGNGSSGVQIVTAIADSVKELHCFIRHPQYTVPARLREVTLEERQTINADYDNIWRTTYESSTGFGFMESTRPVMSVSAKEREEIFESLWKEGNAFRFLFGAFGDIFLDEEANEEVCKFIRSKISQVIKDPQKAAVLTPQDSYTRRPLCDSGYWSKFNKDNVHAIDIKEHPITSLEQNGVRTADGTLHELDLLVLATGFRAVDGSFKAIHGGIRGRHGLNLSDHWGTQPKTYMSLFVSGFPNLFIIGGPQGPFSSAPPGLTIEIDFLEDLLRVMESRGTKTVEASTEAESEWVQTCDVLFKKFLVQKTKSWMTGTNIPGVRPSARFYYGGLNGFVEETKKMKDKDYRGLVFA
ncbi:cyclohexanone monooxygenase [Diaporthe eres]|nr:cyclohexanone monooxygenase [Diaporthe eres]